MEDIQAIPLKSMHQVGLFLLSLVFGSLIFVKFSYMRPMLPDHNDHIGRFTLILGFLVVSLLTRRSQRFEHFCQVLFACFMASLATTIDY
jgi:hypothetical protein